MNLPNKTLQATANRPRLRCIVPSRADSRLGTIRSTKFPAYPGEEEEVNPGLWGRRLAEYFYRKLKEQGIETKEIFAEDWGWTVPIRHEAFSMWVGCSHDQEDLDGYLVFVEPSKPTIQKGLFKKIDTTGFPMGRIGHGRTCSGLVCKNLRQIGSEP